MKTKRLVPFFLLICLPILQTCKEPERQMLVTTGTITNILTTTADAGGEILDLGEGGTKFGHCYSTSPNAAISGTKTEYSNPPLGGFTSALTGLAPETKYYIKAYLSRGSEVVYGKEITFTTLSDSKPEVDTDEITGIDKTTAVAGGEVTGQGGTPVTERGVCYSMAAAPTIDNNKVQSGSGTGKFSCSLSGLTSDKKYYVRAYAKNMGGISYGNERSFTTLPDLPVPPTVTTDEVTQVTSGSAVCGGNVTAEGSSPVTAKGVCWGPNTTPTIEVNNKTNNGTGTGHYTSNLTGLDPGTKYFIRAYATNSAGTSYGTEYNFTTSAVLPTLNTLPVTLISSSGASSGGNITSTGGASIIAKGVCWKTSPGPNINDNKTENGIGPDDFVSTLTNLLPGTKYYVRAYATNSVGPGYGNELEFTTYLSPITITGEATSIAKTSAVLTGTVNANGQSTTVSFEYGLTTSYGLSITAAQSPVTGTSNNSVSADVSGLAEGTTYHFRVKASSAGGTVYGEDRIFTTLCNSPTGSPESATNITSTSATLNGIVNANGFSTTVTFEYGTSTSYGSSKTASQSPVSGITQTPVSVGISGLLTNTIYYYRIKAENCGGIFYSTDYETFTTSCTAPSATTGSATGIGTTNATLNALINPNGASTVVTFEYGSTTSYGNTVTASQSPVSGTSELSLTAVISGLESNRTYHYRVAGTNCGGVTNGVDQVFTTHCVAPSASSGAASGIGTTNATLNGTVNPNGFSTTVTFEYGTTTSYGNTITAVQSPLNGTSNTAVSAAISGLVSNTVMHYRVKAVNCSPTSVEGNDMSFPTLAVVTSSSVSNITGTTASSGGTITPGGGAAITARGVCWSTSTNPTISNAKTVDGTGTGTFTSSITGLIPCTNYHLRAYATNASGTTYGSDIPFTSGVGLATVTTTPISAVTTTTATFGGNVSGSCASTVTARGVCWNTTGNPTISDYKTIDGSGGGSYTSNLNGLVYNTRYYVRAYATNSYGTAYGQQESFITDPIKITDIEGNSYDVVRIGTQLWMGNSMATTKFNDNTSIPLVTDNATWMGTTSPAYCWYSNSVPPNKMIYGALYNWYVVNSGKICPTGWHVPTDQEWTTMEIYLQNHGYNYDGTIDSDNDRETNNRIAKALANTGFWASSTNVGSVGNTDFPSYRNKSLFTANPAGCRYYSSGDFGNVTYSVYFWSTTESSSSEAFTRTLLQYTNYVSRYGSPKKTGMSIRCLRDF
jgi:uncharacterized protein (TIGR02145 family)